MLISREKMRLILSEVYDEGRTSYEELKDSFIDLVISKLETPPVETAEKTKEETKKPINLSPSIPEYNSYSGTWQFRTTNRARGSTATNN